MTVTKSTPALEDAELIVAGPPRGLIKGTVFSIRAIVAHRELLNLLVRRELKARYKDSALGFVWSLVRPLALLLIYYVAIGKFLGAERSVPDFAIFIFTGLTAWGLFSEIITSSTTSIVSNAGLIKKVYLPREIFPLATVGSAGFNFLIQLAILFAATLVTGQFPLSINLLYLPLSLAVLLLFSVAVGLILAAVNVYLRDVQHLVEVLMLVLFWASPIVYAFAFVHQTLKGSWLEQLYLANPVTLIVLGFQKAVWIGGGPGAQPEHLALRLGVVGLISIALLWVGQRIFARLEGNFAQEL